MSSIGQHRYHSFNQKSIPVGRRVKRFSLLSHATTNRINTRLNQIDLPLLPQTKNKAINQNTPSFSHSKQFDSQLLIGRHGQIPQETENEMSFYRIDKKPSPNKCFIPLGRRWSKSVDIQEKNNVLCDPFNLNFFQTNDSVDLVKNIMPSDDNDNNDAANLVNYHHELCYDEEHIFRH